MHRTNRSIATHIAALIIVMVCAASASANPVTNGVVSFEYGFLCMIEPEGEIPAEDTLTGTINIISQVPRFAQRGTTVPAMKGVEFGVLVQVVPEFDGPAVFYTEHPPQGDNGVTRESWTGTLSAEEATYIGFGFEYDFELTPGPWTLSAVQGEVLIYEITFDVVPASAMAAANLNCGPALVS